MFLRYNRKLISIYVTEPLYEAKNICTIDDRVENKNLFWELKYNFIIRIYSDILSDKMSNIKSWI